MRPSHFFGKVTLHAEVAKLVDALRSGRSTRKGMEVRVLSSAQNNMELSNKPLITTARLLAYEAHASIWLKAENGDVCPHVVHLQEVADLVWASGGSDAEIAAAWLHDSVEDTALTNADIALHCGDEVASLVHSLTDYDEWVKLPVLERKMLQAERIKNESESVRRIKLCDQTSNVRGIATSRPLSMTEGDCKEYAAGARRIVEGCKGISPMLENLFEDAYATAILRYGRI